MTGFWWLTACRFDFGRNGAYGHIPKLPTLPSHHRRPKLRSLSVLRRGSDDSGYSSPGSPASRANCDPTQSQDEKVESLLAPESTSENAFCTWSSPASACHQTPSEPLLRNDLTEEPAETRHGDLCRYEGANGNIRMLLPAVDAIDSRPEPDTESCCSDMTCTVDKVLESDWPGLGVQCVTDEDFLARKEEIANTLKAPLWWNYGVERTMEEREHKLKTPAWWTCCVAQPQGERASWVSTYRRSLHS